MLQSRGSCLTLTLHQFFQNFRKQKPVTGSLYNDGAELLEALVTVGSVAGKILKLGTSLLLY